MSETPVNSDRFQNADGAAPVEVAELCVNLDDISAEIIGQAQQTLLDEGALDVWTTAIGMKKQRPGVMLSLLCPLERQADFARRMMELTGSFGVRHRLWQRTVLQRRHVTVETIFGFARLKVGSLAGRVVVAKPEYDDVLALAKRAGQPLRVAMQAAEAAASQWLAEQDEPPTGGTAPPPSHEAHP